eukprot:gene25052-biopygen22464
MNGMYASKGAVRGVCACTRRGGEQGGTGWSNTSPAGVPRRGTRAFAPGFAQPRASLVGNRAVYGDGNALFLSNVISSTNGGGWTIASFPRHPLRRGSEQNSPSHPHTLRTGAQSPAQPRPMQGPRHAHRQGCTHFRNCGGGASTPVSTSHLAPLPPPPQCVKCSEPRRAAAAAAHSWPPPRARRLVQ